MSTTTLDPKSAITAAVDELLDELRQALAGDVDAGEVDGLLDTIGKALGRARRRITTARKRATAEPAPKKPTTQPAVKPAPAATPKPAVPARTTPPATPRKTVTIPRTPPAPSRPRPTASKPASTPAAPGRGRHRRPTRPTWLLPVLLVAAVLCALTAVAGISWTVATTVLGAAAFLTRDRWLPLTTTIRLPKRNR